jgi:protein kinase A
MPGLSFLKKKRTREEQPASSSSKQQQHGDATQQQQKQPSQGSPASGQTQAIAGGGAGSGVQSPHAAAAPQQQQQAAPTSTTTATVSSGANTNANTNTNTIVTNSSAGNAPPPSRDAQNLSASGFNHLVHQPQHEGANQSNTSLNSPSPMSHAGAIAGPPIAPIPSASTSASPGTDPNALYQQQQAARPPPPSQAQPSPNAMQTDQPHQQQLQPQSQNAVAAAAPQGHQPRVTKGKYSLTDFDILRTLGTGSFGRVHLVQSKHNQRFYAIKVLKKAQVVKMKQVEHTNDERRMLSDVKHPFLITLWGTFQDWKNLYMVMDFVEGGELFSLLRKSGVSVPSVPIPPLLCHMRGSLTRRASMDDNTRANESISVRELT